MAAAASCPKCHGELLVPRALPATVRCPQCGILLNLAAPSTPPAAAEPKPVHAVSAGAPSAPAAPVAPTAPKLVAGLQLKDELARGGLGVVYLAYHPLLKDFRAVKRPLGHAVVERDMILARFQREVEALGSLRSKHVVRAHDAGTDEQGPFLVTEYLDGEPLSRLLTRHRRLPVTEACELVRQAALGLQTAHDSGLVHRDIKLSNLVLARDGPGAARVVIVDWGLVKQTGRAELPGARLTGVRMQMGTPDFLAPEQIRDAHTVDIRADIYSLGVTLYCLLAGYPPFHTRPDEQKLVAQVREEFPPLANWRPDVPEALVQVLARMVRKDPAQRYQTPAGVAEALEPFSAIDTRLLLSLLAPISAERAAPVDTRNAIRADTLAAPGSAAQRRPSLEETILAPRPPATAASAPRRHLGCVLAVIAAVLATGFGTVLVCGGLLALRLWKKDVKAEPANEIEIAAKGPGHDDGKGGAAPKLMPAGPLLQENFREAFAAGRIRPKGWEGDAYKVGLEKDEPCLQLSRTEGVNWVTLPPVRLDGDFSINGKYLLHFGWDSLSFRLDSSKTGKSLLVLIEWNGRVSINGDKRAAPQGFRDGSQYQISREGRTVTVRLNGMAVGDKDLGEVVDYDSVKIHLLASPVGGGRIFEVTILPFAEGARPIAAAANPRAGQLK